MDNSVYELAPATKLHASNVGGLASAKINGAGYAEKNGVFVATDDPGVTSEIVSAGGQTTIEAAGMLVAARQGDLGYGSDSLLVSGSNLIAGPMLTSDGGNANAYSLSGKKWVQNDPNIKLYVNPIGSGLTTGQMLSATTAAAETWDAATNQELFSSTGTLTTAVAGKYDGRNTLSFFHYNEGGTALASAGTWYGLTKSADGYYPIVESDVAFNSNYRWTTTGGTGYDFQSVALHELGHSIGLGDLYNKPQYARDTRQVMHYYTGVKQTLGNGDKTGVWQLYH